MIYHYSIIFYHEFPIVCIVSFTALSLVIRCVLVFMKSRLIKIDSDEATFESTMRLHRRQAGLRYLLWIFSCLQFAVKTRFGPYVDFGFVTMKGELYNCKPPQMNKISAVIITYNEEK